MARPMRQIQCATFGGGNWADEKLSLLARSHAFTQGGWAQQAPMEASDLQNVDFVQRSLTKRRGSALIDDSSSVHASGEVILGGFAVGTTQFKVGKKSLYRKASGGSWTIMRNSADSGSFAWDSDNTKFGWAFGDGYAFVGGDGANNEIQVIDPGSNIVKPELKNANNYTEQKGGGTQTITGTWPTGCYILAYWQGRLCMSTGDSIVEFTDVDQPWDLTGGGFWQFDSNLIALKTFIPRGENELLERLFGFTDHGPEIISGFDGNDVPFKIEGGGVPLNHRCVATSQDWLIYPTKQQTVEAINLVRFIDLGRRGLNGDGSTGPLDNLDPSNSNHATLTHSFFDRKQKQWSVWYPDGASRSTVSMAFLVDMQLGEPGITESQDGFESHTRPLWWAINTPATNAWFVGLYQVEETIVGVLADGKTYTYNSGLNDLGTIAILDYWDTPEFGGVSIDFEKNWRLNTIRSEDRGNWTLDIQYAINGDPSYTDAYSFTQAAPGSSFVGTAVVGTSTLGDGGRAKGSNYIEVYGETIRFRVKNQRVSEDWLMAFFSQEYQDAKRQL